MCPNGDNNHSRRTHNQTRTTTLYNPQGSNPNSPAKEKGNRTNTLRQGVLSATKNDKASTAPNLPIELLTKRPWVEGWWTDEIG